MHSSTRRFSRFVAAYLGAAFQVVVMGGTDRLAEETGVLRMSRFRHATAITWSHR
ncbi:hypothetical protein [Streptomyces sp. NPDC048277]|uniref:hypothetical protein n=1 Tax=Streptomyces sp. NPDC048277 TaxID=3155027 RepID=UPI0033DB0D9D